MHSISTTARTAARGLEAVTVSESHALYVSFICNRSRAFITVTISESLSHLFPLARDAACIRTHAHTHTHTSSIASPSDALARTHARTNTHTHTHTHTHTCTRALALVRIYMHTCCACMHTCCTCMHTCAHTCTRAHVRTHAHESSNH